MWSRTAFLRRRLVGWPTDVAMAVVLAAVAVKTSTSELPARGLALLMTLPLAGRGRLPLAALAVIAVAHLVNSAAGFERSAAGFVALLICLFTVSQRFEPKVSVPVASLIAAGTIYVVWTSGLLGIGFGLAAVIANWVIGHDLHTRHRLIEALEDRARSLERARQEEGLRAIADERARIARELHDLVAHSVGVMVVQAAAGRRVAATSPAEGLESLASIERVGREAMVELRRLLSVLRSEGTDGRAPQPGLEQLEDLIQGFRAAGLRVDSRVAGRPSGVPPGVDLSLYRIVQEALTNCLKHAPGSSVRLDLRSEAGLLVLEVVDDGAGRPAIQSPGSGHGLLGMRERAAMLGGELTAGPQPGGGWRVAARLPLGEAQ
jgi:signal transduction histidine kinase